MDFKHRKLMSDSINETSKYDCNICYQFCLPSCADFCPGSCIPNSSPYIDQYPPPSPISDSTPHTNSTNKFLIVTSTIIAAAFLVLCCLVYYIKCFRQRSNHRRRSSPRARDEFFDEDHGPIVDHPIWYINTVGLQPSIIHSISVCKYKKGEGLVEGTDCSVCLNEFQEDETLRLLPKCNHAFHIPCIDTWLRSHTSCPMCRAPIVSNAGDRGQRPLLSSSSSSDVNNEDSGGTEEQTQVVIMEDGHNGEAERGTNGGISEINDEDVENLGTKDETQPVRRSVSLDSVAVCQINKDLFNGGLEGSNSNSDKGRERSLRIVSRRGSGNQSLLRLMCQSSNGRSLQSNQNFMRRSVSFSGIFSLPKSNNKSHSTNPPSRSF